MTGSSSRLTRLTIALLLYSVFPVAWAGAPFITQANGCICIFRMMTGKPCVFCGLTRAFAHATHCEFGMAFSCHPLWWLAALVIFALATISLVDSVAGTDFIGRFEWLERLPVWVPVGTAIALTLLRWLCLGTET
jgi:hypothetical protein